MNKEQQELLDKAYIKYLTESWKPQPLDVNEFENVIKQSKEFSEKWGLNIEERELDMMERWKIADLTPNMTEIDFANYMCNKYNVPTKLIIIKYNDKTIESYE